MPSIKYFTILTERFPTNFMAKKFKYPWFVVLLTTIFIGVTNIHAQIKLEVIYPKEGSQVTASESTFIFGNVSPIGASFTVNNVAVNLYPNGAFLAVVPVEPGNFSFVCQAVADGDTARLVRSVYIPYYLKTSILDSLVIDTSYVFPQEDWELQPGDVFKVGVKGTPGCTATFSIAGLVKDLPTGVRLHLDRGPIHKCPMLKEFTQEHISFRHGTGL
jgi:hypothetical protein